VLLGAVKHTKKKKKRKKERKKEEKTKATEKPYTYFSFSP
jgi:hypothetical protein